MSMSKVKFIETLVATLNATAPEGFSVTLKNVQKVNKSYTGLMFSCTKLNICPVFNVDEIYEKYQETGDFYKVASEVLDKFGEVYVEAKRMETLTPTKSNENLTVQLINAERNAELLKTIPHKKFCDLALICRLVIAEDSESTSSAVVTNELLKSFGMTEKELFEKAILNTQKNYPAKVRSLTDVIRELLGMSEEEFSLVAPMLGIDCPDGMPAPYVVSNGRSGGAVAMLYDGILSGISEYENSNLFIFPSSTDEVIILPTHALKGNFENVKQQMKSMVFDINREAVPENMFLSDNVYMYDKETGGVFIV